MPRAVSLAPFAWLSVATSTVVIRTDTNRPNTFRARWRAAWSSSPRSSSPQRRSNACCTKKHSKMDERELQPAALLLYAKW